MKAYYASIITLLVLLFSGCTQPKLVPAIDSNAKCDNKSIAICDNKPVGNKCFAICPQTMLDKIEKEYGIFAKRRAVALVETMNEAKNLDDMGKMEKINSFFNDFPYESDQKIWGVSDYWATRLEFIGKGKGDCEDFVVAKYFTLKELGIPIPKLFITYAKSLHYKTSHVVLTYYETPNSIPLVMDNYNYKILPSNVRTDLIPIYSFHGDDLFDAKQTQIGKLVPASTRQTRAWDELIITQ